MSPWTSSRRESGGLLGSEAQVEATPLMEGNAENPLRRNRSAAVAAVKAAGPYVIAATATSLLLVWVLQLWSFNLSIPFVTSGDGLLSAATIKGILDNGWYYHNNFVGAPAGQTMYDFPSADTFHFLLIKGIALFNGDYGVVMNVFFLAGFPLTALTSLFVFRRFAISIPVAVVGSILFAFVPYHLLRGEVHLFLSAIYIVPLSIFVVLKLCTSSPPMIGAGVGGRERLDLWRWSTAGYLLIAALTACSGIYYAYFSILFIAAAGIYGAIIHRSARRLLACGAIAGTVAILLLANALPSLVYQHRYGDNPLVAQRQWSEAETFSVSISKLLMPVPGHRIQFLSDLKNDFMHGFNDETTASALGFVGGFGFLFLLGWLVFARRGGEEGAGGSKDEAGESREPGAVKGDGGNGNARRLLHSLAAMNLFAILVGATGGFGLLIAFLVFPEIRAYNRISVFISFFCLMAVLVLVDRLRRKYVTSRARRVAFFGGLALLLAGSLLDQTTGSGLPFYREQQAAYAADDTFFEQVESSLPAGSSVFQLPCVLFPESPPMNLMADYEHFKAYLHTKKLRWSYGVMQGRPGDSWQFIVAAEPTDKFLSDLTGQGFRGIYIDRAGYADNGVQVEQQLEAALQQKPLSDGSGRLLFFNMNGWLERGTGGV